jgi:hypothetical protein
MIIIAQLKEFVNKNLSFLHNQISNPIKMSQLKLTNLHKLDIMNRENLKDSKIKETLSIIRIKEILMDIRTSVHQVVTNNPMISNINK